MMNLRPLWSLLWLSLLLRAHGLCLQTSVAASRFACFQTHSSGLFGEVQPLEEEKNASDTVVSSVFLPKLSIPLYL
jgi:hypothetical protein